jgi:hypothetical protein
MCACCLMCVATTTAHTQVVLSNLRAHGYTDKLTLISDEGKAPTREGV